MPKLDLAAVPVRRGSADPPPFEEPCRARTRQRLGEAGGLRDFWGNRMTLPPGGWSSQRHWHAREDEFVLVLVLDGELVLVEDGAETLLLAGDAAVFGRRPGEPQPRRALPAPGQRAKTRGLALAAVALGLASASPALAAPCGAESADTAVVRQVGDDLGLVLEDGRQLRIAGIDPVRDTPDRPRAAAAAQAALAAWLGGREVRVLAEGPPDRWNRIGAFVSAPATPADGALLAVAVQLVDAGLARARPEGVPADCFAALLRAEAVARDAVLGLWADPYYAVRVASEGPRLLSLAGEWVVVEGRVAHVGRTRTATYLDLDTRRGGLALRLARSVPVMSAQGGPGQDEWIGRRLRARGVLDDRNGPQLDIRDPAQIELLPGSGKPGGAADAGK